VRGERCERGGVREERTVRGESCEGREESGVRGEGCERRAV